MVKTVIKVCVETENIDIALSISKQNQLIEEYLNILIIKLNKYEDAINILNESQKSDLKVTKQDKINLYCKFGSYFLYPEEGHEDLSEKFFDSVLKFVENNKTVLDKKDMIKLIRIFIDSDKFFKILFEKMDSYLLDFEKDMIHRRIELYLKEGDNKDKIIEMIKNERYAKKYDSQYLIMLFKNNDFSEGVKALYDFHKYIQEILSSFMKEKDYENIIKLCQDYGEKNHTFWWESLDFFINKEIRKNLNEEEITKLNKNFEEFLDKLLESGVILSTEILNIINEKNGDFPLSILNNFLNKAIEKEINSIEVQQKKFDEYDTKLNGIVNEITNLKTKAYVVDPNTCSECKMPINFPFIVFKCGHIFHNLCAGVYSKASNNIQCSKCKEGKNKFMEEFKNNKSIYNSINNFDKMEKELNKNKDKVDFIHKLYGEGLFDLSPINDFETIN